MRNLIVGTEALESGRLTRRELRRDYTMVYRNVYLPRGADRQAASGRGLAVVEPNSHSGGTVGFGHARQQVGPGGCACRVGPSSTRQVTAGIVIRKDTLADDEVEWIAGIDCTTVQRTAFDLGRRLDGEEPVIRIDALLNATGVPVHEISALAQRHQGARNIRQLRGCSNWSMAAPNPHRRPGFGCYW